MSPALLALFLIAAPPLRDTKPDWLAGETTSWPRALYLTGVGSGDDRATAEERARAELARVFSARIVSTVSSYAMESSVTGRGTTATKGERTVADDTRSSTEKQLVGAEIAATWQDPGTREFFALAVLERRKAAAGIQSQLDEISARARVLRPQLAEPDRLTAALAAMRLLKLARAREPLLTDLRVVSFGPGVTEDGFAAASAEAEAATSRLVVAVVARGSGASEIEAAVVAGLGTLGIRARSGVDHSSVDLVADASDDLVEGYQRDGWHWARAAATVRVRNPRTGETIGESEQVAREASTRPAEAQRRALAAAAQAAKEALARDFQAWLDGRER